MSERPIRGPIDWLRDNAFILTLTSVVAIAVIGDRVARSGISPADDPRFAAAPAAEQPADAGAEQAAQKPEAQPTGDKAEPAQQQADTGAAKPDAAAEQAAQKPEAQPTGDKAEPAQQQADTGAAKPAEDGAANGGSSQEGAATSQPAAAPTEGGSQKPQPAPDDNSEKK